MKGEDHASLEKPPNHSLFDAKHIAMSPVLKRRLNAQKAAAARVAAPVFNFTIRNDLVDLLHPVREQAQDPPSYRAVDAPALLPVPVPAPVPASYNLQHPTLLQHGHIAGPDMTIREFCTLYDLTDAVHHKFTSNLYMHTCMLRVLMVDETKEMNFLLGEIAALQDALNRWSVVA
jgi:hypothetical protein